jgi:hypothetical protein
MFESKNASGEERNRPPSPSTTYESAQDLTVVALRQFEKAAVGILAIPAALAAGAAAGVMHFAAWVERGMSMVEGSIVNVGRHLNGERESLETRWMRERAERHAEMGSAEAQA